MERGLGGLRLVVYGEHEFITLADVPSRPLTAGPSLISGAKSNRGIDLGNAH